MHLIETMFREVVTRVGGTVLPADHLGPNADFLFYAENVVAELKTLEEDARIEHGQKVQALVDDWMKRGYFLAFGRVQISLRKLPEPCQLEWIEVLEAPIENIVRKANRQIRATKERMNLPIAKGLLLIGNEGNLLHTSPEDYVILVSRVLRKMHNGVRKFPEIDALVYFSHLIPSKEQGLPFWFPGRFDMKDVGMGEFQRRLQDAWFAYLSERDGRPLAVLQLTPNVPER